MRSDTALCRWLAALPVVLLATVAFADTEIHGPVIVWEDDPTTQTTVLWLEREILPPVPTGEWLTGPAGFGFNAVGVVSELRGMPGRAGRLAMRRAFQVDDPSAITDLELDVLYDDAFVAYLNGSEIARAGVVGDPSAPESISHHQATSIETFPIDGADADLRPGENVFAIEALNVDPRSTDFVISPCLKAVADGEALDLIPWEAAWQVHIGAPDAADWRRRVPDAPPEMIAKAEIPSGPAPLKYREAGSETWHSAPAETHRFADAFAAVRRVRLTGLKPDTPYEFFVAGDSDTNVPVRRFRTAPSHFDEPATFVTGGDMYHRLEWLDAMNRRAGAEDPLFALLGGDLAYANAQTAERWYDWFDSWAEHAMAPDGRAVPMIVAIGNHETGPRVSDDLADRYDIHPRAKFYISLFGSDAGRTHHVVDVGDDLSVVVLDSGHVESVGSQTGWLQETLESRQDRRWIFACYHRPAFGAGVKGDIMAIREAWSPYFEQHGVTAVFENDHHVYKRTHPLREGVIDRESGVPYLGDGAWGVNVRNIPASDDRPYIVHAESVRHLIRVDLADDSVRYSAMTADGRLVDEYVRETSPAGAR